ncbi:hypothetical protein HM1_0766 [Heliomicrobium modesticaldum Ice1]|uniref:Uncharacterized protein n=1 Tax=Heliobacterium modesticaldum (strain ATCC 51547 / Ice1) TaxID=498761 RepID=B0TB62_HELMI|nr:hypothetical protein [Heliomicrobium modesticaldum]ABZ83789.1 hypothetical protein HM1_0766 [Heliomicrobium modesticaldum Ice1]
MITLRLCSSSCCPTVHVFQGMVVITDDDGGQVTLTKEQLKLLVDRYDDIEAMK